MKPIRLILTTLFSLFLTTAPLWAQQQHTGPYLGAFVGGSSLLDSKASGSRGSFKLEYDAGLQFSAVAGWDVRPDSPLGEGRIELEYNHRSNPLDQVSLVEGSFKGSGNLTSDSLLLNCFGVFHSSMPWSPYVGLGIGAAVIKASGLKVTGQPLSNDSDVVLAYQLGAGIDYSLTDYLNLDLGYRFSGTTRPKFSEAGSGNEFGLDYYSHNLVFGVRLGF